MGIKYRTLDGRLFDEAADAEMHAQSILKQVKMWDWNENPTTNTAQARLVHLIGEGAAHIFKTMVMANSDDYMEIDDSVIDDADSGWFYWDEYTETYRYIDEQIINILIAANHQI